MWYITSQKYGANALGLKRVLGLGSYQTGWEWRHKLRRAMVRSGREKLSGVVEVDETLVGGKKPGKRGRGAEGKTLVMIAVEDKAEFGFGRIRLGQVPDASGESLTKFVEDNIVDTAAASEQMAGRAMTVCPREGISTIERSKRKMSAEMLCHWYTRSRVY